MAKKEEWRDSCNPYILEKRNEKGMTPALMEMVVATREAEKEVGLIETRNSGKRDNVPQEELDTGVIIKAFDYNIRNKEMNLNEK